MGPSEPLKQRSPFPSPRAGTFQILRVHLGRRVGQTPSSSGFGKALWHLPLSLGSVLMGWELGTLGSGEGEVGLRLGGQALSQGGPVLIRFHSRLSGVSHGLHHIQVWEPMEPIPIFKVWFPSSHFTDQEAQLSRIQIYVADSL